MSDTQLNISDMQAQVREFMQKAGQECPERPVIPDIEVIILRSMLIREELSELDQAFLLRDITEAYDAILDLLVVVIGTGVALGLDLKPGWEEVHKSNMAKFAPGGRRREDGKWLKPPGWKPPQLDEIIKKMWKEK